jgi:8-oxo-dGTP pyrophosphatase MutT (NUDIX family)
MRKNPTFWGTAGAGILFVCEEDQTYFLMHRSRHVEQPRTWGIPGGSVKGEGFYDSEMATERPTDATFWKGAKKETKEECGDLPNMSKSDIIGYIDFVSGSFIYRNFIVSLSLEEKLEWTPTIELNWENDAYEWIPFDDIDSYNLHFGVVYVLDNDIKMQDASQLDI